MLRALSLPCRLSAVSDAALWCCGVHTALGEVPARVKCIFEETEPPQWQFTRPQLHRRAAAPAVQPAAAASPGPDVLCTSGPAPLPVGTRYDHCRCVAHTVGVFCCLPRSCTVTESSPSVDARTQVVTPVSAPPPPPSRRPLEFHFDLVQASEVVVPTTDAFAVARQKKSWLPRVFVRLCCVAWDGVSGADVDSVAVPLNEQRCGR